MSEFALVYRNGGEKMSPDEMQAHLKHCLDWFKDLLDRGIIKDPGVPLGPSGSVVVGRQGVVRDGPFAEAKDVISGFTLVQVKDIAEAIEIAKSCPVALTGGSVEVRPVEACS
ncbi:MAG: YciI family protein [Fimbriimonas sp.]|nr:YciI family protein [Fimbriimonas sp.]